LYALKLKLSLPSIQKLTTWSMVAERDAEHLLSFLTV